MSKLPGKSAIVDMKLFLSYDHSRLLRERMTYETGKNHFCPVDQSFADSAFQRYEKNNGDQ